MFSGILLTMSSMLSIFSSDLVCVGRDFPCVLGTLGLGPEVDYRYLCLVFLDFGYNSFCG